jgi:hypothetical protein
VLIATIARQSEDQVMVCDRAELDAGVTSVGEKLESPDFILVNYGIDSAGWIPEKSSSKFWVPCNADLTPRMCLMSWATSSPRLAKHRASSVKEKPLVESR